MQLRQSNPCGSLERECLRGRANVYRLSRAVPTHGSGATHDVAPPEPARPAGQRTAPRRLQPRVGRSRTSDMGYVTARLESFWLGDEETVA